MTNCASVANLRKELEVPVTGHLSRTLQNDESAKIILFSFAAGHGLAGHRAPMPAIIQILRGEAVLTLGPDTREAAAGFWVSMPPQLNHSLVAKTPVTMLLTLLKLPASTARIG
jgi:quercetin dioxygenase-like cupin family protein